MYELVLSSRIARWQQILDLFKIRDIYFTRDYLLSALKLDPGEAMLFYYIDEEGHGEIVYPFIKRQLMNEETSYYDITSPFGYGGPFLKINNDASKLAANFIRTFSEYCGSERILAEFIRFHPVLNNAAFFTDQIEMISVHDTYTLQLNANLSESEAIKNSGMESEKANGFSFKKLGTVKHMFEFLVLYYSTIRKNEEKDNYYFFTNDYFESLVSSLGPDLQLFGIYKDSKLLAAAYVLAKGETIYHHLSGKSEDEIPGEAETELLNNIAEWGASSGFKYFHIGNKNLLASSGSGESIQQPYSIMASTYFIARLIHDRDNYEAFQPLEEKELIKRYGNS
ncbi:GNAT family N-acetyltransferase [Metaplanococcus flavidus]|uniref:GNAT family N-acetyltransferase n=1 Tax=Metaplanococcus flavidus TaxID=569883 RepID=A0ABW3LAA7_9BACL